MFWKVNFWQNAAIFSLTISPLQILGTLPTMHIYITFALDQIFFSEVNTSPSDYNVKHSGTFVKLTCLSSVSVYSPSPCRKRAESDSRKSSIPNSKEVPSHHPTDPVELRRLNFQTPGKRQ